MKAPNGLIYYRQGQGPSTLLLHPSLGLGRFLFHRLTPLLAPFFSVLTWDPRGIGDHREMGPSLDGWIEDVETLMGLADGPVHLLGVSLGTWVMGRVASRRPDQVASLVLVGSTLGFTQGGAEVQARREELARIGMQEFGRQYAETTLWSETQSEVRDNLALELAVVQPDVYLDSMQAIYTEENAEVFAKISCPTFVMVGAEDRRTTPTDADRVADTIPHSVVRVIPRAGHLAVLDQPQRVADLVDQFCRSNGQAPLL